MPNHSETRFVPYTAQLMYEIVSDVERYPQFVPWCAGLRVDSREKTSTGEELIAEAALSRVMSRMTQAFEARAQKLSKQAV